MGDDNAPKEKNNEPINLTVHGQDGSVIHFKIKRTTPFKKLMNAYCQRLGLTLANVRFTCDGEHVQYEDTPESLDLHDNDTIEVFQTQTGGN
ncbi:Small ubiquitin-related modifier 2-A [Taenia solium]|eukprot:TsM_000213400 transcript=TsM_000213400 gene=TsM_000213400